MVGARALDACVGERCVYNTCSTTVRTYYTHIFVVYLFQLTSAHHLQVNSLDFNQHVWCVAYVCVCVCAAHAKVQRDKSSGLHHFIHKCARVRRIETLITLTHEAYTTHSTHTIYTHTCMLRAYNSAICKLTIFHSHVWARALRRSRTVRAPANRGSRFIDKMRRTPIGAHSSLTVRACACFVQACAENIIISTTLRDRESRVRSRGRTKRRDLCMNRPPVRAQHSAV